MTLVCIVLVALDAVFSTDTYWCALFSIEHDISKVGGRSQKLSRLLENRFNKPMNQLITRIVILSSRDYMKKQNRLALVWTHGSV
jgi:hypothetical protein